MVVEKNLGRNEIGERHSNQYNSQGKNVFTRVGNKNGLRVVGKIVGKVTTKEFNFLVEEEIKKFDYVEVYHKNYGYVISQILELTQDSEKIIAKCGVIGYLDKHKRVRPIRLPFSPGDVVYEAPDDMIRKIINIDLKHGAYVGKLDGKNIKVYLDLEKFLTKHVAILAKSGSGKSYTVGVLLEELIENKVPVVVIDPHGEYNTLKYPNDDPRELELMKEFDIEPKSYLANVVEFGDIKINPDLRPLKLKDEFSPEELIDILPTKLSNAQLALLYSAIKNVDKITLSNLIYELENEESSQKWPVINVLSRLAGLDYFSLDYTPLNEIVQSGRASIINLKGISPEIQDIIVYTLIKSLFEARKLNKIPPFFLVIEEAHNFAPEKNFGITRSVAVIRTVASEGRKFGLGLCVISQRPARVEKSVLSQCSTNIILKITNPNDLKAVSNSVEGLTIESEKEIQHLPIGTALITGVVDIPLFVNIRPRRTKHGGKTQKILNYDQEEEKFFEKMENFAKQDLLPLILPKITKKDLYLMSEEELERIDTYLIPGYLIFCEDNSQRFNLLVELMKGNIVTDLEEFETKILPDINSLTKREILVLEKAYQLTSFTFEDFIKKTGFGLQIKETLLSLIKKGYLLYKSNKFYLNPKMILSNLSKFAYYGEIKFQHIDYDMKLEPKKKIDEIKDQLSKFVNVLDVKECFIVRYVPVRKFSSKNAKKA